MSSDDRLKVTAKSLRTLQDTDCDAALRLLQSRHDVGEAASSELEQSCLSNTQVHNGA